MDVILEIYKEKIKNLQVSSAIYETLQLAIIKNILPPNYRIKEEEFAQLFHVSRTPVRAALNILRNRGLVVSDSKNGYVIKGYTTNEANNIVRYTHVLRKEAAYLTAQYASLAQIAILEQSLLTEEKIKDLQDHKNDVYIAFQEFNLLIAKFCNNKYIYSESKRMHEKLLTIHFFYTDEMKYEHPVESFIDECRNVFEAIANHDSKRASEATEIYDMQIFNVTRHMYNLRQDYE